MTYKDCPECGEHVTAMIETERHTLKLHHENGEVHEIPDFRGDPERNWLGQLYAEYDRDG